jgi:hypothetical protein
LAIGQVRDRIGVDRLPAPGEGRVGAKLARIPLR